jgi:hypothetical protein
MTYVFKLYLEASWRNFTINPNTKVVNGSLVPYMTLITEFNQLKVNYFKRMWDGYCFHFKKIVIWWAQIKGNSFQDHAQLWDWSWKGVAFLFSTILDLFLFCAQVVVLSHNNVLDNTNSFIMAFPQSLLKFSKLASRINF